MKNLLIVIIVTLIGACNADPGIIDDDTQQPPDTTHVAFPLICDTLLPVPNEIYSNGIGEVLVFTDSLKTEFDTLVCVKNESFEKKSQTNWGEEYCQTFYSTGYETRWLKAPQKYSVVFRIIHALAYVDYLGESVGLEDYFAKTPSADNSVGLKDEIIVNNQKFFNATVYDCLTDNSPCVFVQSFIFAKNKGLVAFQRKGKWWVVMQ